ncbi:MAG: heat shock protein 70 family protein [Verrucomicrobiales bacterium]|nr:heat shock protein 70 family protein [Verrucomicrobiales bacterium]
MSEDKRWIVGIDLGTSNCAVAYASSQSRSISDFLLPQIAGPGQVKDFLLLPSFLYFPVPGEFPPGSCSVPWENGEERIVGRFARERSSKVSGRSIFSAKSWLSHAVVDRQARILPWGGAPDCPKLSPVEATAAYLRYISGAWNSVFPDHRFEDQEIVITIPASFDESARELTVAAAKKAGYPVFHLIEEPQAAVYHFIHQNKARFETLLGGVRTLLVADVGGGTSDFTLLNINKHGDNFTMERTAVGDHLILGGDNMDAALAHFVESKDGKSSLNTRQLQQLLQACREAKENFFKEDECDEVKINVVGEGSKLLGNVKRFVLQRKELLSLLLDGFFPECRVEDPEQKPNRPAFQELGLPFASDPAITRNLLAFLKKHSPAGSLLKPDAILLNGGVFNAEIFQERLQKVVSHWFGSGLIPLLPNESFDLAVARGAVYSVLAARGEGQKISGGSPRSFYIGIAQQGGLPNKALCIIPKGLEEETTVSVKDNRFRLTLRKPVQFELYQSTGEEKTKAGEIIPLKPDLELLPPLHTLLESNQAHHTHAEIHIEARLTELGTLEVWCVDGEANQRWLLEFRLRDMEGVGSPLDVSQKAQPPERYATAAGFIRDAFQTAPKEKYAQQVQDVKQLWTKLERALGVRAEWNSPLLRLLWDELWKHQSRRRKSEAHEKVFFQLAGYLLRPGFGFSMDDWRVDELAKLYPAGLQFHKERPIWAEYWIAWRRVSGGLKPETQQCIFEETKIYISSEYAGTKIPQIKGVKPQAPDEMLRMAASFEHLTIESKLQLGDILFRALAKEERSGGPVYWALGRVGSRVPFYGSAHLVAPGEMAQQWIDKLLQHTLSAGNGGLFALTQIARKSGDRLRDVDESTRDRVVSRLEQSGVPQSWPEMVRSVVELEKGDVARAMGESLPMGLQLIS